MPEATVVRFHAEAGQYGDFKSSVRAIIGEQTSLLDTPIEVQLVMHLKELTLKPGPAASDQADVQGFVRPVNLDEPRYSVRGTILQSETYEAEWESGPRETVEFLVDAKVPIIVLGEQREGFVRRLGAGKAFVAVGPLHGELSWHDGVLFNPIRGRVQEVLELPLAAGRSPKNAIVTLREDPSCEPFRRITWFKPGHE